MKLFNLLKIKRLIKVYLVIIVVFIIFSWMVLRRMIGRNFTTTSADISSSSMADQHAIELGVDHQQQHAELRKGNIDLVSIKAAVREQLTNSKESLIEGRSHSNRFDTDEEEAKFVEDPTFSYSKIPPLTCVRAPEKNSNQWDKTTPQGAQLELCEREYGCGQLHSWKEKAIVMCEKEDYVVPSSGIIDKEKKKYMETNQTTLTCYTNNNKHVDADTFPHTVCDSSNLVMDFAKLKKVPCLKYRPGFNCKKPTYYTYLPGSLLGKCKRNSNLKASQFSQHFSKEIFSGFSTFNEVRFKDSKTQFIDGTTIFVTREQDYHVNLYHAISDFFATFQMIEMFKLDSKNVQIVLLDEHYESPFDSLWNSTFSFKRPVRKASYFKDKSVRFERAIFQHAGIATQLKSNLLDFSEFDDKQCRSKVKLINSFTDRILSTLGVKKRRVFSGEIIKGLFASSRTIRNQDEVISSLKKHPEYGITFTLEMVDLDQLSFADQVKKVHQSDFIIGYQGPELTHSLFLPEDSSAVLEIWKSFMTRSLRSFEQYSLWKGNSYTLWANKDMQAIHKDTFDDYLTVNVNSIYQTFRLFLSTLKKKRSNLSG